MKPTIKDFASFAVEDIRAHPGRTLLVFVLFGLLGAGLVELIRIFR